MLTVGEGARAPDVFAVAPCALAAGIFFAASFRTVALVGAGTGGSELAPCFDAAFLPSAEDDRATG